MTEADPNVVDPTDSPEDTDPDDRGGDDWTPPSKEEHEKMTRTLAARKKERDDARRELAALKAGQTGGTGKTEPPADPEAKTKRQAGLAALTGAGLTKEQAKDAVRLLNLSGLEVDEDGDVDGIDDAVADLRTKFPGLFPRKAGGKVDTADRGGANNGGATMDATTKKLMQQAGYRV